MPDAIKTPGFAHWVSQAAQNRFAANVAGVASPSGTMDEIRAYYDRANRARLEVAMKGFAVEIEESELGGVPVSVVMPSEGVVDDAVLLCLHGGAFMWGAGAGALIEAVPVAATARRKVIAVDYRLAPEHLFPAAVDDALACYDALLGDLPSGSIGLFGCSAGGILIAQMIARLIRDGRPLPGAIAMLHATGLDVGGDSVTLAATLNGIPETDVVHSLLAMPYLDSADPKDPLVLPGDHPEVLAHFPPSLLISGTRDFAASSITTMHRRLRQAGVDAALTLFDGMWHAHHVDTDLPEARETFEILARFFDHHLGR